MQIKHQAEANDQIQSAIGGETLTSSLIDLRFTLSGKKKEK